MKLIVVRNCLTNNAASWFEMLNIEESAYCEFKKKFLDHYWDRRRQEEIRFKLNQGKFHSSGHLKMADYFIQMGQLARLLEPPIPTDELINLIANHYTTDIRSAIIVSKPRNCEEIVNLLKELQGNQSSVQTSTRKTLSNRNQSMAEVNFLSHGGGAHYAPNRYTGQEIRESPPRESENTNNNRPNRSNDWNRETHGYNGNVHGNDRQNRWGAERGVNSRYNRVRDDRQRGPRINYLNIDRRPRHYAGRRSWYDRDTRETYRNHRSNRYEWERNERPPSSHDYPTNNRMNDYDERRPFPSGIDRESVNGLINRQNVRLPNIDNQNKQLLCPFTTTDEGN